MTNSDQSIRFYNARLVLDEEVLEGALRVENGKIASIDVRGPSGSTNPTGSTDPAESKNSLSEVIDHSIDCQGDFLMPGLVELHTDNFERHSMPRPTVTWPNLFAAAIAHDREVTASGITTVFDSIRVGSYQEEGDARSEQLLGMLDALSKGDLHDAFKADHRLHLRCELTDPRLMSMLAEACRDRQVDLVSLMDHTPGQRQWANLDALRRHHSDRHPNSVELEEILQKRIEMGNRHVSLNRKAVLDWFEGTNVVLATHDDTTRAHVEEALSQGVGIAEFPCSIEAAQAAAELGLKSLGGAPNIVRGASHSGNVSMLELAQSDILHGLSSDYVPASLLQAAFMLVKQLHWSLPKAIALITSNTAAMVGLHDRGRLVVGLRADLIRVKLADNIPLVESVHVKGKRVG